MPVRCQARSGRCASRTPGRLEAQPGPLQPCPTIQSGHARADAILRAILLVGARFGFTVLYNLPIRRLTWMRQMMQLVPDGKPSGDTLFPWGGWRAQQDSKA